MIVLTPRNANTVKTSLTIPRDLVRRGRVVAVEHRTSFSAYITALLVHDLAERAEDEKKPSSLD